MRKIIEEMYWMLLETPHRNPKNPYEEPLREKEGARLMLEILYDDSVGITETAETI